MELTAVQQRTLDDLLDVRGGAPFDPGLAVRLRERIESTVRDVELPRPVWLGKDRLNDMARCPGLFAADLAGERPPFVHSLQSAAGTLLHKVIELDVSGREERDGRDLAEHAAGRLGEDRAFMAFWAGLSALEQDELLLETVRRFELFRATFPPLRVLRRELAPIAELRLAASFGGGRAVVAGQIDLVLGRLRPDRATRVLIDLKTGRAWPEHPEDMRVYALLHTLRFGVPPFRVATLFLGAGDWQAEDVTEATLQRAADRVMGAARAAAGVLAGRDGPPVLTPGPYCRWCPARLTCPESAFKEVAP